MLLIFPPVFRPAEPPAGVARLSGFLKSRGILCKVVDLNYRFMADMPRMPTRFREPLSEQGNTFARRSLKNLTRNLEMLSSHEGYTNFARYGKTVYELNHILTSSVPAGTATVSLSDYAEPGKSPLKSEDLIAAFQRPEGSPLFAWFAPVLESLLRDGAAVGPHGEGAAAAGFSLCFLSQAFPAFAMAGYMKRLAPRLRFVFGGGLITSWMRLPDWNNPFAGIIDRMIAGPGENELFDFLSSTGEKPLAAHTAGITRFMDIKSTADLKRDCVKPITFVLPDYSDLRGNRYLAPGFILPYAASSGCSWKRCRFCPEHAEQSPYNQLAPSEVITQLSALIDETAPRAVHFLDSELSPAILRALAETPFGPPNAPALVWYGFTRFHEDLADPEYCAMLRRAGCVMLKLGLESGSQSVLDKSGKGIELTLAARVLHALKAAGIGVYLYLLFGTPWEGYEEAKETLRFTASHADSIAFLNLALFNLPRGGDLAAGLRTRPFGEGDLSLYSEFSHPLDWNRPDVRRFLDNEFKRHPAIAPIVRRQPPFFGSSHGAFLFGATGR